MSPHYRSELVEGSIKGAEWAMQQEPGLYDMSNVLRV